jgi:hypothetical protein
MMEETLREKNARVITKLGEQVWLARENKQPGVVKELLKKIARIEKRAKKA